MRRARQLVSLLALATLLGSTLIGCSALPTAPRGPEAAPATTSNPRPASAPAAIGNDLDGLIVKTIDLVANVGGSLANGRWSVAIPAGAVGEDAVVTLAVATPTSSACQLEIQPVDLNQFSVPAVLTVDCSNVPIYRLATLVICWRDPRTGAKSPVKGSRVDLVAGTVSAPLQHFSQYSVETKAGW